MWSRILSCEVGFLIWLTHEVGTKMSCYFETSGGYGTLEELLEIITWAQLGIHSKPVRTILLFLFIYLETIFSVLKYK